MHDSTYCCDGPNIPPITISELRVLAEHIDLDHLHHEAPLTPEAVENNMTVRVQLAASALRAHASRIRAPEDCAIGPVFVDLMRGLMHLLDAVNLDFEEMCEWARGYHMDDLGPLNAAPGVQEQ